MYIFAVSGLSKTGKTTVVEAMVRSYSTKGFSTATIKNSACKDLAVENPGTDTSRHRKAGAAATILRSPDITAIVQKKQLSLEELLIGIDYDIVILEGFGSLDEDTLNLAMKALGDLAEGRRLVGIISHVTELKERIERQIVVVKEKSGGSRARIQVL